MTKQKIVIIMFAGLLLLAPVFAQARGLVPCGGYKDDGTLEHICTVNDAFYLAARVTNWLIMLAGLYAVVRIIYAGAMLTFSQGNQESVTKYQGALTNAIIGFVLVMTSFLIVNTVVNTLLLSKCKIDLRNPTTYLSIQPADNNCK